MSKEYVVKRYTGGNPKVIMTIDDDRYIRIYLLNNGQTFEQRHGADVHFYADDALVYFNPFQSIYLFLKRVVGLTTQEDIALLCAQKKIEKLDSTKKAKRDKMLYLIRGVDNYINTLNRKTK